MSAPISRRWFIGIAAGAAGLAATAAFVGRSTPFAARGLTAMFPDPSALEDFGRASRRVVGSDARRLARDLAPDGRDTGWVDRTAPGEIREHLRRTMAGDLAAGRIVDVAGWQVSRTEARVAALVSLAR